MTRIKKEHAVKAFGSQAELARALNIGRSAVCMWRDGADIPGERELQIRVQHPAKYRRIRRLMREGD